MEFRLLGPLEVVDSEGNPVAVNGTRLRRLLAVLVLHARQTVSVDQLTDVLWGDRPPVGATNALQVQVSKLRRLLDRGGGDTTQLHTAGVGYQLDVAGDGIDVARFETLLARGQDSLRLGQHDEAAQRFAAALDLWRGDALADFAFDDFAQLERARLSELRLGCREGRFAAEIASGSGPDLVAELDALCVEHPWRERLAGQLMTALYRAGRQSDALRAFQRLRSTLVAEMGLEPGPDLVELERRVLNQDPTLLAAAGRADAAISAAARRPPRPSRPCVGRASDVAAITERFVDHRHVTITGPGGVGKTRLALELVAAADAPWNGDVWMVELGPIRGPEAIDAALTQTFIGALAAPTSDGVRPTPVVQRVAELLGSTQALVLFDNCEHVIDAAAGAVEALLAACPRLRILATSREPFDVAGEVVHQLQPLPRDDAVELFVARATEASTRFSADDDALAAIGQICARLDRLPLAIELAAARTRAFTVHQLASRLQDRFALSIAGSGRGRPQRHSTLHAAVEWSYDLLFDDERILLARLAVFAGGFSLEAAEAVCPDDTLPAGEIAALLARLVDKSLVVFDGRRERPRYHLLQAVADFAAERLDDRSETTGLRDRHLHWLTELTEHATAELRGPNQLAWIGVLRDEGPNLGRASQWTFEGGDPALGLRVVANLGWYVFLTSRLTDYFDMAARVLHATPDATARDRTRVMGYAGLLGFGRDDSLPTAALAAARDVGDPGLIGELAALAAMPLVFSVANSERAGALLDEASAAAELAGDGWLTCFVDGLDGARTLVAGDPATAHPALVAASRELHRLGDRFTASLIDIRRSEAAELIGDIDGAVRAIDAILDDPTLSARGVLSTNTRVMQVRRCWFLLRHGQTERALRLAADMAATDNQRGHRVVRAATSFVLGAAHGRAGHAEPARHHLTEALEFHEQYAFTREAALDLSELARVEMAEHHDEGVRLHRTAVDRALDTHLPVVVALCLDGLASGLMAKGDYHHAALALGAAQGSLDQVGASRTPAERAARSAAVETIEARLGEPEATATIAAGRDIDVTDLVAQLR